MPPSDPKTATGGETEATPPVEGVIKGERRCIEPEGPTQCVDK